MPLLTLYLPKASTTKICITSKAINFYFVLFIVKDTNGININDSLINKCLEENLFQKKVNSVTIKSQQLILTKVE